MGGPAGCGRVAPLHGWELIYISKRSHVARKTSELSVNVYITWGSIDNSTHRSPNDTRRMY